MIELPRRYVKLTIQKYNKSKRLIRELEFEYKNSKGYRIDFSVIQFPGSVLNTAEIQVYNLSEQTSAFLTESTESDVVILEAGYNKKSAIIFKGNLKSATREKNGPDIINRLYCATLGNWKSYVVKKTVKEQPLSNLLSQLANEAGLTLNSDPFLGVKAQGKTYFGGLDVVLNELKNRHNFIWNIEGDSLNVISNNIERPAKFKFDPSSGLLRIPVRTEKGVDLLLLMEPLIRPNDKFELESRFNKFNIGQLQFVNRIRGAEVTNALAVNKDTSRFFGKYNVLQVVHEGSTHDNVWQSAIEGNFPQ